MEKAERIQAARDLAERFGKEQVIVLMLDQKAGTLEYASYGKTRALCADARRLADAAYDAVMYAYMKKGAA